MDSAPYQGLRGKEYDYKEIISLVALVPPQSGLISGVACACKLFQTEMRIEDLQESYGSVDVTGIW